MGKVKIKVGDKAPVFKLESYNGGMIDLAEIIGKQKIVLIFSRYFGCPICQLDLQELLEREPEIEEKQAKILYITQSGPEIAKDFIEEEDLSFPVIPSTKDKLYAQYGLGKFTAGTLAKIPSKLKAAKKAKIEHGEYEGSETQCPGQFVIDENGVIIHAAKGWLNIDKIVDVL
jgi:peroxiredoxin